MEQTLGADAPREGDPRWQKFLELTAGRPPWEMLVRAARLAAPRALDLGSDVGRRAVDLGSGSRSRALDLGCGAGRDSIYLAHAGFRVVAVDAIPAAGRFLEGIPHVQFVCSRFEDFEFGDRQYELINAHFSLPFVGKARFGDVFGRARAALAPRGVLTGQFFGPHDAWNLPGAAIAFHSQTDAEELLSGLDIVEWREVEEDGHTADGSAKHWHLFHFIARLE